MGVRRQDVHRVLDASPLMLAMVCIILLFTLTPRSSQCEPAQRIVVGTNQDGRLEVVYIGNDGALQHKWQIQQNGDWADAATMDTGPTTAVAIGSNFNSNPSLTGRLEVFYVGRFNILYHAWQTAPNSPFSAPALFFGYTFAKNVAVKRNADGRLEVFWITTNNVVWHAWQQSPDSGNWGSAVLTSSPLISPSADLSIGQSQNGTMDVYYVASDSSVQHVLQRAPNSGWLPVAPFGITAKTISAAQNADGRIELFYIDNNDTLNHKWQTQINTDTWGSGSFGIQARLVRSGRNWGRCFRAVDFMSDGSPKLVAIDEKADHQIVHGRRFGKANRATHETFDSCP